MERARTARAVAAEARRESPSRPAPVATRSRTRSDGRDATLLSSPGRPLDPATRTEMERSFGRDFGRIRIHDDSRADRSARSLGARAYSAGDDLVFAQGQYAPRTEAGRALIAHELAHSVQQAGVAMKSDGPFPVGASPGLEAEADRAALAVGGGRRVPALTRGGTAAILRSNGSGPAVPAPPYQLAVPTLGTVRIEEESPAGVNATYLRATIPILTLPFKGSGEWVASTYQAAAKGGALLYSGKASGGTFKADMDPVREYRAAWLQRHRLGSLTDLATLIRAGPALVSPNAEKILSTFEKDQLKDARCDIDHIIEKQLQGSNIPENLQLLSSSTNQTAGSRTRGILVDMANQIRTVRPKLDSVRLSFPTVEFEKSGPEDEYLKASFEIEALLRKGFGTVPAAAVAGGAPVGLLAGGKSVVTAVKAAGETDLEGTACLLITGMRLTTYKRDKKTDKVAAKLAVTGMDEPDKTIALDAAKAELPAGASPAAAGTSPTPSENRSLTLAKGSSAGLRTQYPFLSPATIKTLTFESDGAHGTGVITPSLVKFLGPIDFTFAPGVLKATTNITPKQLKTPAKKFFRFTKGELALELAPKFIPSGTLEFTIGPESNPVIAGSVVADYKDGAFVATGDIWPARPIPGISKASGKVEYHSQKGWSGKLAAESSSIPLSTATAEFSFAEQGGELKAKGSGAIVTTLKGKELSLGLDWAGGEVAYSGKVAIADPLPLIKTVTLGGRYAKGVLRMSGDADIAWNQFKGSMKVVYVRKDGEEEGRFSGEATVSHTTEKSSVKVNLKYSEGGKLSGSGTASYQVTKDIRPELGIVISEDGRIKATGEAKLKDIPFGAAWPAPPNNNKKLLGAAIKFSVPTPLPAVTAFLQIYGSLGVRYGVGPVTLKGVVFIGELYPLERDPRIKARLKGALVVPTFGEIYGSVGANLGVEVLGGAIGAKGGIEVRPALRVQGEAGIGVDAVYASGAFAFSAEAYAKGQMYATLKVNLKAEVSAGWGFWTHEWIYNIASFSKKLGPELKVTLGRIAYSPQGGMTWPNLSQIKLEPPTIDAKTLINELMTSAKDKDGDIKEPKRK